MPRFDIVNEMLIEFADPTKELVSCEECCSSWQTLRGYQRGTGSYIRTLQGWLDLVAHIRKLNTVLNRHHREIQKWVMQKQGERAVIKLSRKTESRSRTASLN